MKINTIRADKIKFTNLTIDEKNYVSTQKLGEDTTIHMGG